MVPIAPSKTWGRPSRDELAEVRACCWDDSAVRARPAAAAEVSESGSRQRGLARHRDVPERRGRRGPADLRLRARRARSRRGCARLERVDPALAACLAAQRCSAAVGGGARPPAGSCRRSCVERARGAAHAACPAASLPPAARCRPAPAGPSASAAAAPPGEKTQTSTTSPSSSTAPVAIQIPALRRSAAPGRVRSVVRADRYPVRLRIVPDRYRCRVTLRATRLHGSPCGGGAPRSSRR